MSLADQGLIRQTMQRGARRESEHFVLYRHDSLLGKTQFCFRAPRRLGKAVARNRMRRLMREFVRTHRSLWPRSAAVVLVPKQGTFALNSRQVATELQELFGHE